MKASRGDSRPRSVFRTRRWRSPPTSRRAAEAVEKASSGAVYCSRPIDIDIIFYDDEVIGDERLTVPHPLLAEREFALVPLCEIMRQRRHPVTGATVGEMLDALRNK